jgi:hypothetical protein
MLSAVSDGGKAIRFGEARFCQPDYLPACDVVDTIASLFRSYF